MEQTTLETTTSADGTSIAYERSGTGEAVILAAGAFNDRRTTAGLARALERRFTVFNFDRRGRGDSGDTAPYAVEREVEDVAALLREAGGSAHVFGYSSGAYLMLHAAAAGLPVKSLALYEPPVQVDDSRPRPPADIGKQLDELIAAGRRGEAVELYQLKAIGLPEQVVIGLRDAPFRPGLEAIAHTLAYDAALTGDVSLPVELASRVEAPTVVICGTETFPFMQAGAKALADALPNGRHWSLVGESHDLNPEAIAPVMEEFFSDAR